MLYPLSYEGVVSACTTCAHRPPAYVGVRDCDKSHVVVSDDGACGRDQRRRVSAPSLSGTQAQVDSLVPPLGTRICHHDPSAPCASGGRGEMGAVREEFATSKRAILHVITNPALRRLFSAYTASLVGNGVFTLTVAVVIFRAGGASSIGVLAVTRYVAIGVFAPLTSRILDRHDRRSSMAIAEAARTMCTVLTIVAMDLHSPVVWIGALVVLKGVAGTGFYPAQMAVLPQLSRTSEELAAANVVTSLVESVGVFAGPALAGLFLAFSTPTVAIGVAGVAFAASTLLLVTLSSIAPTHQSDDMVALLAHDEGADAHSGGFLMRALDGFRLVGTQRDLRALLALYVLQCIVYGASTVFSVAIALQLLHIGSAGLGLMESVLGVGGLCGGVAALILVERSRLAWDFGLAVLAWGAPLLIIAFYPHLSAVLAVMAFVGLANSIVDINYLTVIQHMVPNDHLGRVLGAVEAGEVVGMAMGAVTMTGLIHVVGIRSALGLIGGLVALATVPGLPTMRRIDRENFKDEVRHHPHAIFRHRHTRYPNLHRHLSSRLHTATQR